MTFTKLIKKGESLEGKIPLSRRESLETPEFQEDDHHLSLTSEKGISKEMHKSLFFTTSFKLIELFFSYRKISVLVKQIVGKKWKRV